MKVGNRHSTLNVKSSTTISSHPFTIDTQVPKCCLTKWVLLRSERYFLQKGAKNLIGCDPSHDPFYCALSNEEGYFKNEFLVNIVNLWYDDGF